MLEVLLIRHGQSQGDVEQRIEGSGWDAPLTPLGHAQARALARRLQRDGYVCDVLYSSPLARARATAARVAEVTGCPVTVDERLRELDLGAYSGMAVEEAERLRPGWFGKRTVFAAPPRGESVLQHHYRVAAFYYECLSRHGRDRVCVVAHGGTLNCWLRLVYGLGCDRMQVGELPRFRLGDTSLNRLSLDGGSVAITHYLNDCSHAAECARDEARPTG